MENTPFIPAPSKRHVIGLRCAPIPKVRIGLVGLGQRGMRTLDRYAFISDYLDVAMRPFRQLQYDYYRKGLDAMALNPSRARNGITESLTLLDKSHAQRPMSLLPQIWTDYKRDELANIYKGNGTAKERESIYNLLFGINPSQHTAWEKIKE